SELASAIAERQCTRADYDGRGVDAAELSKIHAAATLDDVQCLLVTERPRMEAILEYVVQGNTTQLRDKAFMAELTAWIRFNDRMVLKHLDGLSTRTFGKPSSPAWLAEWLLPFVMTEKGEANKYASQIRSSAGIAVFAAASNDRAGWIAA